MKSDLKLIIIFMVKERDFAIYHKYEDLSIEEKAKIFDLISGLKEEVK